MNKVISIMGLGLAFVLLQCLPADPAHARQVWHCDKQPVQNFWEVAVGGNELSGRGSICATPWGIWSWMQVRGLTPGNAYTVWWVYIDQPGDCVPFFLTPADAPIPADEPVGYAGDCGLVDFAGVNPLGVFGRMDSVVPHRDGRIRFGGGLRSFVPSSGSQVWMWIFGHGAADEDDNRHRARQLLTPEDPNAGAPHLGNEVDGPLGYPAGVVVFEIP